MGVLERARAQVERVAQARAPETQVTATSDSGPSVVSDSQWKGFTVGGLATESGVRVDERNVIGLPGTMQALRILCGVFAMTPLHYYQTSAAGRNRAQGALQRLLHDAPNGYQTAFEFRELLLGDIMLAGNFYAYVSRDFAGQPVALTRLMPGTVVVAEYFDRSEGMTLFYDAVLPDSTRGRFPARDIWHVRGMSRDGIVGLSPLRYAREALGGSIATQRHVNEFWSRGGKVDTALTSKHRIEPMAKARMRADWEALHNAPGRSRTAILDQDTTVQFLTHDHQKSQFVETRAYQIVDLARIWGVPPHLIFDLSKATYGNIEQQSLEFVIYHLGPHFARIEQAATRAFAENGHFFEHLTDALVRGDLKSRMEAYWLQRQMGMVNGNELRRRENLSDIPGPAGQEYWRPGNMTSPGASGPGTNGEDGA